MAKMTDYYCLFTSGLWLMPKYMVMCLPLLLLQLPAMIVAGCYAGSIKAGTDAVERTTGFWLSFLLAGFMWIPAGLFAMLCGLVILPLKDLKRP